jgi:hypothetical protein
VRNWHSIGPKSITNTSEGSKIIAKRRDYTVSIWIAIKERSLIAVMVEFFTYSNGNGKVSFAFMSLEMLIALPGYMTALHHISWALSRFHFIR